MLMTKLYSLLYPIAFLMPSENSSFIGGLLKPILQFFYFPDNVPIYDTDIFSHLL